jgi:hypothetical protein
MEETQGAKPARREPARYKLLEKCYLNDRLYDPETMPLDQNAEPLEDGTQPRKDLVIAFAGVPAHYMVPMNETAKAMCEKHKDRMQAMNPIDELTMVTRETAKA